MKHTSTGPGRRRFLQTVGAVSVSMTAALRGQRRPVERILLGNVRTLDDRNPIAQAVAIADGKILAVGPKDQVLQLRGVGTQVHDLGNSSVIPGFNDTHTHLEREGLKTLRPSLAGTRSITEVLARVEAIARGTQRGAWIVTMPIGEAPYYSTAQVNLKKNACPRARSWIAPRRTIPSASARLSATGAILQFIRPSIPPR